MPNPSNAPKPPLSPHCVESTSVSAPRHHHLNRTHQCLSPHVLAHPVTSPLPRTTAPNIRPRLCFAYGEKKKSGNGQAARGANRAAASSVRDVRRASVGTGITPKPPHTLTLRFGWAVTTENNLNHLYTSEPRTSKTSPNLCLAATASESVAAVGCSSVFGVLP